jgi:hypothetical protein
VKENQTNAKDLSDVYLWQGTILKAFCVESQKINKEEHQ